MQQEVPETPPLNLKKKLAKRSIIIILNNLRFPELRDHKILRSRGIPSTFITILSLRSGFFLLELSISSRCLYIFLEEVVNLA